MRWITAALVALSLVLTLPLTALAQSAPAEPTVTVPRLIQITGVFQPADGQPPAPVEVVTLSIYAEPEGGLPVWQEQQTVAVDRTGRFTLLLGRDVSGRDSGGGVWLGAGAVDERAVRAGGGSGAGARADRERAVCAAGVGRGDARGAPGRGVPAGADGGRWRPRGEWAGGPVGVRAGAGDLGSGAGRDDEFPGEVCEQRGCGELGGL